MTTRKADLRPRLKEPKHAVRLQKSATQHAPSDRDDSPDLFRKSRRDRPSRSRELFLFQPALINVQSAFPALDWSATLEDMFRP
jgi:hypothetical protein